MSEFDRATQILDKAKQISPDEGMIANLYAQIKRAVQIRDQKEKKMYQKMFG